MKKIQKNQIEAAVHFMGNNFNELFVDGLLSEFEMQFIKDGKICGVSIQTGNDADDNDDPYLVLRAFDYCDKKKEFVKNKSFSEEMVDLIFSYIDFDEYIKVSKKKVKAFAKSKVGDSSFEEYLRRNDLISKGIGDNFDIFFGPDFNSEMRTRHFIKDEDVYYHEVAVTTDKIKDRPRTIQVAFLIANEEKKSTWFVEGQSKSAKENILNIIYPGEDNDENSKNFLWTEESSPYSDGRLY